MALPLLPIAAAQHAAPGVAATCLGPGPPAAAWCSQIRDVAAAIAYLHSVGVVHGDLSGNNVLLRCRTAQACLGAHAAARACCLPACTGCIRGACPGVTRGSGSTVPDQRPHCPAGAAPPAPTSAASLPWWPTLGWRARRGCRRMLCHAAPLAPCPTCRQVRGRQVLVCQDCDQAPPAGVAVLLLPHEAHAGQQPAALSDIP